MQTIRRELPASGIRKIFEQAAKLRAQGRKIISLDVGRPDFPMPPSGVRAAQDALENGLVHYIPNRGLPELLELLSKDIADTTGRKFNPETEIVTTLGASEAVMATLLTLVGPGDEVIIPTPSWHHYEVVTELAGGTPTILPLTASEGFIIDPDKLSKCITDKTKLIVVMSPGNPTGAVQPPEVLKRIAEIALDRGIYVFSDEAYEHFTYGVPHRSIGEFMGDSPLFIHCGTFSKSYAMTGWRIGYVSATAPVADAINRVHQHTTVCGVHFAHLGAIAVLKDPERKQYLQAMNSEFTKRRDVWADALTQCDPGKLRCIAPQGAFYLFPELLFTSGEAFSQRLLEEVGLSTVPGACFGKDFTKHLRIAFGGSLENQKVASALFVKAINGK